MKGAGLMRRMVCLICLLAALLGCAAAEDAAVLDLRGQRFAGAEEIEALLGDAPGVTAVDLTGVALSLEDRAALVSGHPEVKFLWTLDVFGVPVDADTTRLDFGDVKIGDFELLAQYLRCFPGLERVLMYETTTFENDREMLYANFPDLFFGFTLRVMSKTYTLRSDEVTAFSTLKGGEPPYMRPDHMWFVKFCRDLRALDLGHNMVTDLSFLYTAPKLKVLILADNHLTDITPLSCQTELEYLELFLNDGITDISALAGLKELRDLNLAFDKGVTDLTPLYDLPHLERLWLSYVDAPQEQIDRLFELYPDTEIVLKSYGSTGVIYNEDGTSSPGWREHPHYPIIYHMFNHSEYVGWDFDFHTCPWCNTRFSADFH